MENNENESEAVSMENNENESGVVIADECSLVDKKTVKEKEPLGLGFDINGKPCLEWGVADITNDYGYVIRQGWLVHTVDADGSDIWQTRFPPDDDYRVGQKLDPLKLNKIRDKNAVPLSHWLTLELERCPDFYASK
jgi:hypothetical protein